jgi:hypothetical protein
LENAKHAIILANNAQTTLFAHHVLMDTTIHLQAFIAGIAIMDVVSAQIPILVLPAILASTSRTIGVILVQTGVFHAVIPKLAPPAMMDTISLIKSAIIVPQSASHVPV